MRKIRIGSKEYEIHYGQNSVCALEDELQEAITDILTRIDEGKVRFKDVRALIWSGLLKSDRGMTPEKLGEICDEAGISFSAILPEFLEELTTSFKRLVPEEPSGEEGIKKK